PAARAAVLGGAERAAPLPLDQPRRAARPAPVARRLGAVRALRGELRLVQQDLRQPRRRDHPPRLAVDRQRGGPARRRAQRRAGTGAEDRAGPSAGRGAVRGAPRHPRDPRDGERRTPRRLTAAARPWGRAERAVASAPAAPVGGGPAAARAVLLGGRAV